MGARTAEVKAVGPGRLVEDLTHRCAMWDVGGGHKVTFRLHFDNGNGAGGHWFWMVDDVDMETAKVVRMGRGVVRVRVERKAVR